MSDMPMTPREAFEKYRGREGDTREEWMARWHSQSKCTCCDYLSAHFEDPPHRCRFGDCSCRGFVPQEAA